MVASDRTPGLSIGMPVSSIRIRSLSESQAFVIQARLPGGARTETIPGQASIVGRMLAEGSSHRNWEQIAEQAECRGMSLSTFGGLETIGLTLEALARDWERALEWAAELILESTFPADRFEWLVQQSIAELQAMADEPEIRTGWAFLEQLYRPHPRSRPIQGTPEGLTCLTREDCLAFWREGLLSGPLVTLAGGIEDESRVLRRVESAFGGRSAPRPVPRVSPPQGSGEAKRVVPVPGADQGHLFAGHLTVSRADTDLPALQILSVILGSGSGLSGRIPQRVREREGLAYAATASATAGAGLDVGRFVVYLGTDRENLERAQRCALEEIDCLVTDGVSEKEVEEAKSYLVGREPFRRETSRQWADLLAESELYEEPLVDPNWSINRWLELSREDVEAAARRHLRPSDIKVTVGLPVNQSS